MEITVCSQCGKEIEGQGIQFRGRAFCGDECCDEFEVEFAAASEPEALDLSQDDAADDTGDGLGYRDDVVEDGDDILDDDVDIRPEDF